MLANNTDWQHSFMKLKNYKVDPNHLILWGFCVFWLQIRISIESTIRRKEKEGILFFGLNIYGNSLHHHGRSFVMIFFFQ